MISDASLSTKQRMLLLVARVVCSLLIMSSTFDVPKSFGRKAQTGLSSSAEWSTSMAG